jgi:hypothetical protein
MSKLSTSSSAPSLSESSKRSKKVAGKGRPHRRALPTPPQSRTSAGEREDGLLPSHQRDKLNVPQHLTYMLKPDSPFQNYTTPRSRMPAKASQHVKRSVVHGKLSSNPILSETKKISEMLHPPPDPIYFTSFLESTIPKAARNKGGEPYFLSSEPTPLEIAIDNCVTIRDSYVLRLRGLTANKVRKTRTFERLTDSSSNTPSCRPSLIEKRLTAERQKRINTHPLGGCPDFDG